MNEGDLYGLLVVVTILLVVVRANLTYWQGGNDVSSEERGWSKDSDWSEYQSDSHED